MPIGRESNPQSASLKKHPLLAKIAGEAVWWLNTHVYMYEVLGNRNLYAMTEQLKRGSLLAYFNHRSGLDPGLILRFLNDQVTDLSNVYFFTSQRRLDPNRGVTNNVQGFNLEAAAQKCGFHLLPTVQGYEIDIYPNALEINRKSAELAKDALLSRGKVIVITPEGTRSKTGSLQKGSEGTGILLRIARKNALAVPLGIMGTREHVPRPTLAVGNLVSYEKVKEEAHGRGLSTTDVLMKKLAVILPPEYRGVYS